jgi:hypothetical protein
VCRKKVGAITVLSVLTKVYRCTRMAKQRFIYKDITIYSNGGIVPPPDDITVVRQTPY